MISFYYIGVECLIFNFLTVLIQFKNTVLNCNLFSHIVWETTFFPLVFETGSFFVAVDGLELEMWTTDGLELRGQPAFAS